MIKMINEDELSMTRIALEGATVNEYRDAITLNVVKETVVKINPKGEVVEDLKKYFN